AASLAKNARTARVIAKCWADKQTSKGGQTMRRTFNAPHSNIFTQPMGPAGGRTLSKATRSLIVLVILTASLASAGVPLKPQTTSQPWNPVATFSILGFDPDTQEIG